MVFHQLLTDLNNGKDVVLATIISRNGSAPRMTGARMLVYFDGQIFGTIGGGQLEARSMDAAKTVFFNHIPTVKEFKLTGKDAASSDMICGGNQEVLLEFLASGDERILKVIEELVKIEDLRKKGWIITELPNERTKHGALLHVVVNSDVELIMDHDDGRIESVRKSENSSDENAISIHGQIIDILLIRKPEIVRIGDTDAFCIQPIDIGGTVYIFGGGHVSQQLAKVTTLVGFRTVIIDDREDFANRSRFPEADEIHCVESFEHAFNSLQLDPSSYMVIVTRGHLHDHIVLADALKTSAVYIGMIGSKRKVETIYQALEKDGHSRDELSRVYAPIGIRIDAESPEEIAVSIAAELISVRAKLQIK